MVGIVKEEFDVMRMYGMVYYRFILLSLWEGNEFKIFAGFRHGAVEGFDRVRRCAP